MFYAPAQDVQRPTHPRLHVRDARDAHTVFEAVRQGRLKPVVRRLNELERASYIQSGAIFVWEESDDEMGLKRWTDNRGKSRACRETLVVLIPL
jgi:Gti1/Pac2 family transcription factor